MDQEEGTEDHDQDVMIRDAVSALLALAFTISSANGLQLTIGI